MKKIFLLLVAVFSLYGVSNAQVKGEASECFELTGVAYRLADIIWVTKIDDYLPKYAADIDSCFSQYKSHELISFLREVGEKRHNNLYLFPRVTTCLEVGNGKVRFRPGVDVAGFASRTTPGFVYAPGAKKDVLRFVELLNDFYRETNFRKFYDDHAGFYNIAVERANKLLEKVDVAWFESRFGVEWSDPIVVVSPSSGRGNYARNDLPDPHHDRCMVIGVPRLGEDGLPVYYDTDYFTMVHEFMHTYANPRVDVSWDELEPSATKIFPFVQDALLRVGYSESHSMVAEWLTNLFTLMYLKEHGETDTYDWETGWLRESGFIWIERSIAFMDYFYENRDKYPSVDDFMPRLVEFMRYTADNFDVVKKEFDDRHPYVVDSFPIAGSTVSTDTDTIAIRFSEPMNTNGHGLEGVDEEGMANLYPLLLRETAHWKDEYTFVFTIDKTRLEKGRKYGIIIPRIAFDSKKYAPLKEDYLYHFTTAE